MSDPPPWATFHAASSPGRRSITYLQEEISMSMSTHESAGRPWASALGRLTAAGLLGVSLSSVVMAARMYAVAGEIAPPVFGFVALPLLAAAALAVRRRWAPIPGAVVSVLILLMLAPHLLHILGAPADTLFAPFVLITAFALIATLAGALATAQNYRRPAAERRMPRWMPLKLAALVGLVAGIFLMASQPQHGAAAGISADVLERLPAVETERFEFVQQEIRVRAGELVMLRLVNADAATHSFDIDEFDVHTLMPANATAITIFTADKPGTYTFYCAPHYDKGNGQGMKGTLIVEP
jgi:plastocyanin